MGFLYEMDHFIFLCLVGGTITLPDMCSETFFYLNIMGRVDFFQFFFRVFHTQQSYLYGLYGFLHARGIGGQALFCVYPSWSFYARIWRSLFLYTYIFFGRRVSSFPIPFPCIAFPFFPPFLFLFNPFLLSIALFRVRISPPFFSFIFIK